ncbi:MAG: BadF/BadG/BcrA/BcrD ATPase family protein [Granulicella sp.]
MSLFLALDAGGTKTDYVLADESTELARVRTGTIKRMRIDAEAAAWNLDSALRQLTEQSGISMQSITRTCIGTAGEGVPLVADWLRHAITSRVSGELLLIGDVEIALDAAFANEAGVLVLAGTGSNVAARARTGELISAGGWGPALADQGSGLRIGIEGLRAAFLARDEGRSTLLLQAVMDYWKLATLDLLVEYANSMPPPDFSLLAELVMQAAELGDEVAAEVLRKEGEELAYLVRLVMRRLQLADSTSDRVPPIAFAGSIMEKFSPVRTALIQAIQHEFPSVRTIEGVVDPIAGAIWRARRR